jgi:ADP-ribose pyrophosphatase YjhB (NUDIX family)
MMQMYNVFVNKKLLTIDKKSNFNFDLKVNYSGFNQLKSLVENLEDGRLNSALIIADNPDSVLADFGKISEVRVAAGGKVVNSKGEILFIKREGVWDLPKGFVEKGESLEQGALREIEEETAVSNLEIIDKLTTTYHTYRYRGKLVLKVSHWFNVKSTFEGELNPQTEEGITEVKWLKPSQVDEALKNTWENIKLLF